MLLTYFLSNWYLVLRFFFQVPGKAESSRRYAVQSDNDVCRRTLGIFETIVSCSAQSPPIGVLGTYIRVQTHASLRKRLQITFFWREEAGLVEGILSRIGNSSEAEKSVICILVTQKTGLEAVHIFLESRLLSCKQLVSGKGVPEYSEVV